MIYSNEMVLDGLRRAQYRQVPWPRRPRVFEYLLSLGLLTITRQRIVSAASYHAPVDIAVLTETGRAEIKRLEQEERGAQWMAQRSVAYPRELNPA